MVLALALLWLSWALVLPWLTSPVLLGVAVGAALTARAQVKGYKSMPLFLYTDKVTPPSSLCFAGVLINFRSGKFQALDMSFFSKGHAGFFS